MAVWIFMEATTGTDPEIPPDPAEDLLRRKSQERRREARFSASSYAIPSSTSARLMFTSLITSATMRPKRSTVWVLRVTLEPSRSRLCG